MPKGYKGAWICDVCGKDADLHTTESGKHEYFCWVCNRGDPITDEEDKPSAE